mmetsp:Transcript_42169/g.88148  ORF Transcript_42169/g.88148 Transcript_42169/m.88148 type:complete len:130 (-) Transcript_42169:85-474(-)
MPIWHPTSEKALDELLDAEVDVYNVHGLILKKVFVLNKNIVHLIDDIFWNMGFKTETQADKVRQDIGLADHVWQDKKTLIAQYIDNLGDQFRPAMRTGWLSYIRTSYPEDAADGACPAVVGEEMLVVPG